MLIYVPISEDSSCFGETFGAGESSLDLSPPPPEEEKQPEPEEDKKEPPEEVKAPR